MNRRDFLRAGTAAGVVGLGGLAIGPRPGPSQAARPAAAGDAVLRLNSNENALGLSPAAREAIGASLGEANRYPRETRDRLIEALAAKHGVAPGNILLGNGSTEILQMAVQALAAPDVMLVMADPTFEAVVSYQEPLSYRLVKVPLDADHGHDLGRMREAVAARGPAVVYLCNPGNPTGTLSSSAGIDAWIGEAPETTFFIVDEAYYEYVRAPGYWSAAKWISEKRNLVVTRTFSKIYAMAGLRLGYAVAHPETAARLREFMSSSNANCLALAAGRASLADEAFEKRSRAANDRARAIVERVLDELDLTYLPSHTNFVMHRINGDLADYRRRMLEHGIRVGRPFPPMLSYNRLSLGTPEEMERFAETLRGFRRSGWI